jgi:hypothetical protein
MENKFHHVTDVVAAWIAMTPSCQGVIVGGLSSREVGKSASGVGSEGYEGTRR